MWSTQSTTVAYGYAHTASRYTVAQQYLTVAAVRSGSLDWSILAAANTDSFHTSGNAESYFVIFIFARIEI